MEEKDFKIGTRRSPLALAHAFETRSYLMSVHKIPLERIFVVPLSTKGDRITNRTLTEIGGKGLFTEEIERKLISGEIDFAVHSAKDMPTKLLQGLRISAYLPREDVRDVFISHTAQSLNDLSVNSIVGTSSLRRKALLLRWRADLSIIDFRGKIETRLTKLKNKQADAMLLAYAGIKRLKKESVVKEILNLEDFPPSPGQGAICIETHMNNTRAHELATAINHGETWDTVSCERAFLAELDGSCKSAIAGFSYCKGQSLYFYGTILTPDGKFFHEISKSGNRCDAIQIGRDAGRHIRLIADKTIFNL
ncbi:porphobilinogen deaminase [Candidatus Liberibacter solanacearum]|uniref:Hydroxymethylbilane synthase n=1 Tax=Candidatus Liberibacter solanacearum TaxID=556287 RepID=A0A094Z0W6_9HYPH|nr:hydroxymethylbilane synthase [Candidatus Liberibacter solanacearum]KGB27237.1 porphobilinogen deaminase [Candidatus Liberibacter solanacearum]KJZ81418.1 porphobilinogen deaminase [Candidatus Liberibacter solanacearum]KJZ82546.1 Porphobilinogen deaminase [Candidatus Liberibacter solanacearum]KQC49052.1 porphobilinogen deaminase [Candidatus Liberibacter solanacearum]